MRIEDQGLALLRSGAVAQLCKGQGGSVSYWWVSLIICKEKGGVVMSIDDVE